MHQKNFFPRRLQPLVVLSVLVCLSSSLAAQSLKIEMTTLAETLAKQIKDSGLKKVSVVDFSDLQGNYNELGRFIAEQLTVKMVAHRKDFSMVDRANLKRILEEHKLSMSGLVDPANAKKLGQIAGLDAIIIGNVTPLKSDVSITAKIISTDTAEIVGGDETNVRRSEEIDQLLGRGIDSNGGGSGSDNSSGSTGTSKGEFSAKATTQKFREFEVQLLSFKVLPSGVGFAAVQINNTSKQNTIAVAGNTYLADGYYHISAKILDDKGNFIRCGKLDGMVCDDTFERMLENASFRNYRWVSKMLEIRPTESLRVTLEFIPQRNSNTGNLPKLGSIFKLQAELITIQVKEGDDQPKPRLENIYFDNITVSPSPTTPPQQK